MLENILLIIAGFFLLIKGADILVDGSSAIAKKFNISSVIIGLTIVSIGTSLPELTVCLKAAMVNHSDVSIGSVIGSNICNILLILGICSIISPIKLKKETKLIEIPISLVMIFTLFILANNDGLQKSISRPEGIILLVLFLCFISYTIFITKYGELIEPKVQLIKDEEDISVIRSILFIVFGSIALKFGGDFVVDNITEFIKQMGFDEKILSLTVISIGTSLPELITSITASVKKEKDIAIGTILGSNIFNILLILGVSAIISPINFSVDYNIDIMILFVSTVFLLISPYIGKKNHISKINGIFLFLCYVAYNVSIFLR